MKKLARFLAEMVVHHLFPAVVFTIVFFKALQVMMPNPGDGLGQALTAFIYFIPGLLVWILVWNAVRMLFKTESEPADSPDEPPLDSPEPIKLSAEAEASAKGTPIEDVAAAKPGQLRRGLDGMVLGVSGGGVVRVFCMDAQSLSIPPPKTALS